jgi:hypothetical protein
VGAITTALVGASAAVMMSRGREPSAAATAVPPSSAPGDGRIDWLAASGGGTPEFNQVSLEQDLALAASVLGGRGRVLFAAGPGRPVVQVLAPQRQPDTVQTALADLFHPRSGRQATYRAPEITVDGPATAATVTAALRSALSTPGDPLLVFLGGHGYPGETAIDNTVGLWASSSISAGELAALLDEYTRPTRFVITSCYSGGFGELVFDDGAASFGPSQTVRCGLFASPWDLEASGCDPNPDRARQEGYALHFFNALAGRDRDGNDLPIEELDIDGDGKISLLEAHTRVRIASSAPDVPTSTSERWLRHQFPAAAAVEQDAGSARLPEERRVVARLGARLGLADPQDAAVRLRDIEARITQADGELAQLQRAEDDAYKNAAAELLERWPVLDDPWHPEFRRTFEDERDAIERHLTDSSAYAQYLAAREAVDRQSAAMADLRVEAAPLERVARAAETIELANALAGRGGSGWDRYVALLECERAVPAITRK